MDVRRNLETEGSPTLSPSEYHGGVLADGEMDLSSREPVLVSLWNSVSRDLFPIGKVPRMIKFIV